MQLQKANWITRNRQESWARYRDLLSPLEGAGLSRRPIDPDDRTHSAHMYYVIIAKSIDRQRVLEQLHAAGINALFHYVPLHQSPAGQLLGSVAENLSITEDGPSCIVRLPFCIGVAADERSYIASSLEIILKQG